MNLILARSIDEIDRIFKFTKEFLIGHKISKKIEYSINLVLEEIFTNCVKHNPDGNKNIFISMKISKNVLIIEIIDEGKAFNTADIPDVDIDKPLEERKVGGLGIHLVKQTMDKLDYNYRDGKNHIIIKKYLET